MGQLYDRIIDEAQQAGESTILHDPTEWDICDLINDILDTKITPHTIGGKLAVAAYYQDKKLTSFYMPLAKVASNV